MAASDLKRESTLVIQNLLGLEEQDGVMTKIEIYEVLGFVRNEAPKIPSHYAMPCGAFTRVELFLYVHCNLLFDVVFAHGFRRDGNGLPLHILTHIHSLNLGCFQRLLAYGSPLCISQGGSN